MFYKTSGQITVQQVKILIDRISLGAKMGRTYSLAWPALFCAAQKTLRVKTICSSPAEDFCDIEESLSYSGVAHLMGGHSLCSLSRGTRGHRAAHLGFAAPAACSWVHRPSRAVAIWHYLVPG